MPWVRYLLIEAILRYEEMNFRDSYSVLIRIKRIAHFLICSQSKSMSSMTCLSSPQIDPFWTSLRIFLFHTTSAAVCSHGFEWASFHVIPWSPRKVHPLILVPPQGPDRTHGILLLHRALHLFKGNCVVSLDMALLQIHLEPKPRPLSIWLFSAQYPWFVQASGTCRSKHSLTRVEWESYFFCFHTFLVYTPGM